MAIRGARGYVWLSLGLHAAIGLSLLSAHWQASLDAKPAVSHHQALLAMRDQQDDLKLRLQSLERIARQLGADGDGAQADARADSDNTHDPAKLEQRLRRVAEQIRATVLPERAQDLARMLGIPEEAARATLLAEAKAESAQGLDALQQQAQDALDFRRRQQKKLELAGFPLTSGKHSSGANGDGGGRSSAGQIGSFGPGESLVGDIVDRRGYGPLVEPPTLDSASLHLGTGRIVGASGAYSNRLYVDSWYLIGPFAGIGQASLAISHPPEQTIDLDAVYAGKQGRPVRWNYQRFAAYPLIPPRPEGGSVYYGYTEIRMDEARSVQMSLGADDDAKVWINDELVWVSGNANKPWYFTHFKFLTEEIAQFNLTEATRRVHLRKGRNRILFKLYNSSSAVFFSLVVAP